MRFYAVSETDGGKKRQLRVINIAILHTVKTKVKTIEFNNFLYSPVRFLLASISLCPRLISVFSSTGSGAEGAA